MTPLAALLAFTVAATLLTITPGLDTALVLRTAAIDGPRRALLAGLGVCAGCLAWGVAAALGLGALLAASSLAYDALRIAGAIYLCWLGARLLACSLRRRAGDAAPGMLPAAPAGGGALQWFWRGCLTNMLNPKVGVFYVTFLPQFIPAGVDVLAFSLLLAALHAALGLLWFAALVAATRPLSRWLARPSVARGLDRLSAGVFIAFGLKLALERR